MTNETVLRRAEALLSPWSETVSRPEPNRVDVRVRATRLLDAVAAVTHPHWGYLSAITGLDSAADGQLEALYHFCAGPYVATLRVAVLRSNPAVPSATEVRLRTINVTVMLSGTPTPRMTATEAA